MKREKRVFPIVVILVLILLTASSCAAPKNYGEKVAVISSLHLYQRAIITSRNMDFVLAEEASAEIMFNGQMAQDVIGKAAAQEGVGAMVFSPAVMEELELPETIGFMAACSTDYSSMGLSEEELAGRFQLVLLDDYDAFAQIAVNKAAEGGAKTFVHYYYVSGGAEERYKKHCEQAKEACEQAGLSYEEVGLSGYEGWLEVEADMPLKLQQFGYETAFFCFNEDLQRYINDWIFQNGGIACIPGSYTLLLHDADLTADRTSEKFYEEAFAQMQASVPENYVHEVWCFPMYYEDLEVAAAARYAKLWLDGKVDREGIDEKALKEIMEELTGTTCSFRHFVTADGKELKNYILYSYEPVALSQYRK